MTLAVERNVKQQINLNPRKQGFPEAVAAQIEAPQEDQPDQYMRQSGPYVLQSGNSVIRWTSAHHLTKKNKKKQP